MRALETRRDAVAGVANRRVARFIFVFMFTLIGVRSAMAIEEPAYTVVGSADGYEIRRYPGYCVAETEVAGTQADVGNAGFRILAKYIFGGNESRQSIAMTAPVMQAQSETIEMTSPVIQQSSETPDRYVVQFTMPSKYSLDTLPKPNDARVQLRQVQERVVAVRAYSGGWSLKSYTKELAALRSAIERDGRVAIGAPQWARYNSPFSLPFMRRNEIWVEISAL